MLNNLLFTGTICSDLMSHNAAAPYDSAVVWENSVVHDMAAYLNAYQATYLTLVVEAVEATVQSNLLAAEAEWEDFLDPKGPKGVVGKHGGGTPC